MLFVTFGLPESSEFPTTAAVAMASAPIPTESMEPAAAASVATPSAEVMAEPMAATAAIIGGISQSSMHG